MSYLWKSVHIQRKFLLWGSTLLILLCSINSRAQIGEIDLEPRSGFGGMNSIEGRILHPTGRPLQSRVRVVLSGAKGELSTMTNDNGEFTFRRLPTGIYQLTVEAGKEYQPIYQSIDVRSIRGGRRNLVTVDLQYKVTETAKPGLIDASLQGVPKSAVKLYQKALESSQKGESQKAIEQLNAALAIHPSFVPALNALGVQYIGLDRLSDATTALEAALKIAPENVRLRADYGLLLMQKKQFAEAEKELRWVLERADKSASTHLYLGRTLLSLHNYDEAEKELQRALSLGGELMNVAHRFLAAIYIEWGETKRAIEELETFLRFAPEDRSAETVRATIKRLQDEVAQKP